MLAKSPRLSLLSNRLGVFQVGDFDALAGGLLQGLAGGQLFPGDTKALSFLSGPRPPANQQNGSGGRSQSGADDRSRAVDDQIENDSRAGGFFAAGTKGARLRPLFCGAVWRDGYLALRS